MLPFSTWTYNQRYVCQTVLLSLLSVERKRRENGAPTFSHKCVTKCYVCCCVVFVWVNGCLAKCSRGNLVSYWIFYVKQV